MKTFYVCFPSFLPSCIVGMLGFYLEAYKIGRNSRVYCTYSMYMYMYTYMYFTVFRDGTPFGSGNEHSFQPCSLGPRVFGISETGYLKFEIFGYLGTRKELANHADP